MIDTLFETVMHLKDAFGQAVAIYDAAVSGQDTDVDEMPCISSRLRIATNNFYRELYDVLEPVTDWNEQNDIYELIKRLIDNERMFNGEFTGDHYHQIIRTAPVEKSGVRIIQFVSALKGACSWFSDNRYRLSGFRYWYERYVLKLPAKYHGLRQGAQVLPNPPQSTRKKEASKNCSGSGAGLSNLLLTADAGLIDRIGMALRNKKGKGVATIIRALHELNYINVASGQYKPLFRAIRSQYGVDIGADSGITKYLSNPGLIPSQELEDMKNLLQ